MSITVILGKTKSGKTTLARTLSLDYSRVVAVDPLHQFKDFHRLEKAVPSLRAFLESAPAKFAVSVNVDLFDWPTFDYVSRVAMHYREVLLLVDEADTFKEAASLRDIVARGRHYGVSTIFTSRRPTEIPRIVTSQANAIYSFKQTEPRDLIYMRDYIGEAAYKLPDLPEFHYLRHRDGHEVGVYPPIVPT